MSDAVLGALCAAGGALLAKLIDLAAGRRATQAKLILDLQERVERLLEEREAELDRLQDRRGE